MNIKLKVFYSLGIIISIGLFLPLKLYSASEFSEKDAVLYSINTSGLTHVVQKIQITNLIAESYTNKYSLGIGTQKINNVKAYDKSHQIKTAIAQSASSSAIQLEFADQIIGKNSVRNFTVEYDTPSIVQKLGSVWSLTIPRVSSNDLSEYVVTIEVPNAFGTASSVYPKPESIDRGDEFTTYAFSTQAMTKSGISINFGDKQLYTMGLTYHLSNTQQNNVYTEIALPMNTPYQTISFDSITPKPQSIISDADGNYIARYVLKPKESIDVQVIAKAIVLINRKYADVPLTAQEKIVYTAKQPYWDTDNPKIREKAESLKSVEKIYRYVVDTLTYNSSRVNTNFDRITASKILEAPENSVCMEFTDLFITLARAAGIPAREVNGFAYTNDNKLRPASLSQDTLHAWPEYYQEKVGWTPVDPTWENTTHGVDYFNSYDLNHIAFVHKGVSSEEPYPAGAYKGDDLNTHDVLVNFITEEPQIKPDIATTIDISPSHMAGTPLSWKINLTNKGNSGFNDEVTETVHYKGSTNEEKFRVNIPPFSSTTIIRTPAETSSGDESTLSVDLQVGEATIHKESRIVPFYKHSVTIIGIIYLIGVPFIAFFSYKVLHKKT